jgi:2-furoate---CoA ligase
MFDLGTSFLASVERDPDRLAIVDGEVRLSYRDWYGKVSALAAALDETGLKRGDHVLTAMQNRWENASLHWACQFLGLIVTPLNWRAKTDEIDFGIADAGARAVFYEVATEEAVRLSRLARDLPQFSADALAGIMDSSARDAVPLADAADWSLMLYTSGTTSKPKGVPRRHRAERAGALAHVAQNLYRHGERTLGVMPLYHTMGVR